MSFHKAVLGLIYSISSITPIPPNLSVPQLPSIPLFSYLLISSIPFVKSLIRDWHKCQPLIYFSLRPEFPIWLIVADKEKAILPVACFGLIGATQMSLFSFS